MRSLTHVTALDLASQLPTEVTLSLLTIQEEVNFEKAMTAPVIRAIETKIGRPVLIKLVCAILKLFADSLNITQTLTALQVYELAQLWIEQYPTDTLKDLILCLKRVKQGKYGKIYNRIDIEVISGFWTAYLNEKTEYRENQWITVKAKEASNEKAMLQQIATHVPETAILVKSMVRKTPDVVTTLPTTHERYLADLSGRLPFASESELLALRAECNQAGPAMNDVVRLIEQEINLRKTETVLA